MPLPFQPTLLEMQAIIPAAPDAWVWLGDYAYLDDTAVSCLWLPLPLKNLRLKQPDPHNPAPASWITHIGTALLGIVRKKSAS